MPIYEYQCAGCGHCFETLVLHHAEVPKIACPKCGAGKVKKLMSCLSAFEGAKNPLCGFRASSKFS
ncbi:MAG: zinc ribbon domain-containing protein [Desulfobacteraceae bacterium]|nr:MAG: zinc ribbon domain-containing protein [Desulfobacteraceae bacterium]